MQRRPKDWALTRGAHRVLPDVGGGSSRAIRLVWVAAEGAGSGPKDLKPGRDGPARFGARPPEHRRRRSGSSTCRPTRCPLRRARIPDATHGCASSPRARHARSGRSNAQKAPAEHAAEAPGERRQVQARVLHRARAPTTRSSRPAPARRRRPEGSSFRVAVAARVGAEDLVVGAVLAHDVEHVLELRRSPAP